MDGPAVGWLDQDFDTRVGELLDVARGQRRPPLPGVDVLAADGHDGPVVLVAPLACVAALHPLTMVTEESEHDFTGKSLHNSQAVPGLPVFKLC